MALHDSWEKFHNAILILVTGSSLKDRVLDALSLVSGIINTDDLPDEMIEEFENFYKSVNKEIQSSTEGTLAATINSFSQAELENVARQIVSMYNKVCRAQIR